MATGDIGTNYAWYNARKARNKTIIGLAAGAALLVGGYLLGDNYLDNYKPFLKDVKNNTMTSTKALRQANVNKTNISGLRREFDIDKANLITLADAITANHNKLEDRIENVENGVYTFDALDIDGDGKTENVKYFPVPNALISGTKSANAYEWAMSGLEKIEKDGRKANLGSFNDVVRFYQIMAGDANLNIEADTVDELKRRYMK